MRYSLGEPGEARSWGPEIMNYENVGSYECKTEQKY